ncbi:hypothetical protein [Streptomyces silaceus]|uniref:hypothetical protein n=2 Tax=Streptomyces TaxID=1883 RepID=UPI0007C72060|nr:hypothetical protein [Streptomyces silaceus]
MLDDAMTALAAAGSAAVVQAAGTDAWGAVRRAVARWFGRGDPARERAELARLDRTDANLAGTEGELGRRLRDDEQISWRTRFEIALDDLDDGMRAGLADELRALVDELGDLNSRGRTVVGQVTASGPGGQAVVGDVRNYGNPVNIAEMHGDVRFGHPSPPDPNEG